jgi:hypothetical protein
MIFVATFKPVMSINAMNRLWNQNPNFYSVENGIESMGRIIEAAGFP